MSKILTACLAIASCMSSIPEPYRSIEVLPYDEHGWFGNQTQLQEIIQEVQPKTVIEVGSWLGCSTRFLGTEIPEDGRVYAVDHWLGTSDEVAHMEDPRRPYLYQQFLSNVIHANLTQKIVPIRMSSTEAAKALSVQADLIYIDAGHQTESVIEDILAWYPHLKEGGILCGDDWSWPSVRTAVIQCAEILNLRIEFSDNFWRYVNQKSQDL